MTMMMIYSTYAFLSHDVSIEKVILDHHFDKYGWQLFT